MAIREGSLDQRRICHSLVAGRGHPRMLRRVCGRLVDVAPRSDRLAMGGAAMARSERWGRHGAM